MMCVATFETFSEKCVIFTLIYSFSKWHIISTVNNIFKVQGIFINVLFNFFIQLNLFFLIIIVC